ncbi:hypothetical protein HanIR_Chr09g0412421 [Helianthus annuus]|nr:hypothetical protein HanIR_Chr09g0412421 [Helianthus annuus]
MYLLLRLGCGISSSSSSSSTIAFTTAAIVCRNISAPSSDDDDDSLELEELMARLCFMCLILCEKNVKYGKVFLNEI